MPSLPLVFSSHRVCVRVEVLGRKTGREWKKEKKKKEELVTWVE